MKKKLNNKILLSAITVFTALVLTVGATVSFYSDRETAESNVFVAGSIDLAVESVEQTYCEFGEGCSSLGNPDPGSQHFFDFKNIKAGDWGKNIIRLDVSENDSWGCFTLDNFSDLENGVQEPEEGDDDSTGELSRYLTVYAWHDNNENGIPDEAEHWYGPVLIKDLKYLAIFDSETGEHLTAHTPEFVGFVWCAGYLSWDGTSFDCDPAGMGNDTQSDVLTADLTAYAEQKRNNPDFFCAVGNGEEWDKSSLEFVSPYGYEETSDKVFATIENSGDEDMEGGSIWELYYKNTGNPMFGSMITNGGFGPLESGESITIEASASEGAGIYKFKAYQRPGHFGTGILWSEEIEVP